MRARDQDDRTGWQGSTDIRYGLRRRRVSFGPSRSCGFVARGALLSIGRFLYRSHAARPARADHPWPCRPCAGRARCRARHSADARDHGGPLRRGLLHHGAGGRDRRERHTGRSPRQLSSRRARSGFGPGPARLSRVRHGGLGRLQARGRPHLPAVRSRPLRRLRHGGDLWPTGVPGTRAPISRSPS